MAGPGGMHQRLLRRQDGRRVEGHAAWAKKVVQCDEIAWKLFGLSMAAYNGLVSLIAGAAVLILSARPRHAV